MLFLDGWIVYNVPFLRTVNPDSFTADLYRRVYPLRSVYPDGQAFRLLDDITTRYGFNRVIVIYMKSHTDIQYNTIIIYGHMGYYH